MAEEPSHYSAFARDPAPPSYRRFETPEHPGDELSRVTNALERLSARIEAAEHRSTLAISGVDQSVSGLVSRMAANEREQTAVAARFEGLADDLKVDQNRITERLRRIEQEAAGPRSVEALRTMEAALGKVAGHLYEGEARTSQQIGALRQDLSAVAERVDNAPPGMDASDMVDTVVARVAERLEQAGARTSEAIRGLEISFAQLDDRLQATETRHDERASETSLERLAVSLSAQVDAARAEMAEKIQASADGRFDRMERTLAEMNGHVQTAERRSADAIERMGHEVLRMAETLGRKVADVEQNSTGAIQQVSGEVGRIAAAMETRLTHIDSAGAQALEKLGGEIARITERLAERIANAERRSAQAIDDVGDQMTRTSEPPAHRAAARRSSGSSDLAERIHQSEELDLRVASGGRPRTDRSAPGRNPAAADGNPRPAADDDGLCRTGRGAWLRPQLLLFISGADAPNHSLSDPASLEIPRQRRDALRRPPAPECPADAAPEVPADDTDLLTPRDFADEEFSESAPFEASSPFSDSSFSEAAYGGAAFGQPSSFDEPAPFGEAQAFDETPAFSETPAFDEPSTFDNTLDAADIDPFGELDDEDDGFIKTPPADDEISAQPMPPIPGFAHRPPEAGSNSG